MTNEEKVIYEQKLDKFRRIYDGLYVYLQQYRRNDNAQAPWFLSFGTLLNIVRDDGLLEGDIDISLFYGDVIEERFVDIFRHMNYAQSKRIVDDVRGLPLYMSFSPADVREEDGVHIDVFMWYLVGDVYYHTYDYYMENPKNGIPSKYVFKGIPAHKLKGNVATIGWRRLNRETQLPEKAGELLDYWYPAWFKKDPAFGQSKTEYFVECKSIKELNDPDFTRPQIEKSKQEYHEFRKKYIKQWNL